MRTGKVDTNRLRLAKHIRYASSLIDAPVEEQLAYVDAVLAANDARHYETVHTLLVRVGLRNLCDRCFFSFGNNRKKHWLASSTTDRALCFSCMTVSMANMEAVV